MVVTERHESMPLAICIAVVFSCLSSRCDVVLGILVGCWRTVEHFNTNIINSFYRSVEAFIKYLSNLHEMNSATKRQRCCCSNDKFR